MPENEDQFSRTRMLLGDDGLNALADARVCVFGVGGVGGYVVEALARGGIGALDLVDSDIVTPSNINRQIIATWDTIGRPKVEAAAERVRSINPNCRVTALQRFYLSETRDEFDFASYDYVVDAVDTLTAKLDLVLAANAAEVPIISCMGAGNKLDPTMFEVADISKTSVCPLARRMRKELRKRGVTHLKCVFSKEQASRPDDEQIDSVAGKMVPGSVSFVPSVAGLIIAGEVIKDLVNKKPSDLKGNTHA